MSTSGGLLQLIVKTEMDNKLTGNPEIFPFLKTYKKHHHFSIDNNIKYIGNLKMDNKFSINISNSGDLLGNLNFILKIPKKFDKVTTSSINSLKKTNEYIFIEMNNTTYYLDFFNNEKKIILKPTNYLDNVTYIEKDFYLETHFNSVILNLLKSYDIKILYNENFLLNELNKFNNLQEKYLLNKNFVYDNNIISNEHYILNNYFQTVEEYFTKKYNFFNNLHFNTSFFEINKNFVYENDNSLIIADELVNLIVSIMNLTNINNQRFILDFGYLFNTDNNEYIYTSNNIISNIEINNNFEINYKNLIGNTSDSLFDSIIIEAKKNYASVYKNISFTYNKDFNIEKDNLLNQLMNYRLNMNDYIVSLNNILLNEINLEIPLKINFNNRLKNLELTQKVNLVYKFLLNLDITLNNIRNIIDDETPVILLKRIFYSYIFIRDFFVEDVSLMMDRKIMNYFTANLQFKVENLTSNNFIKNNFYLSIDKQYPLNKNFVLSEIKRTQNLDHCIIFHDKISNHMLKQVYTVNVDVKLSNLKNYNYKINLTTIDIFEYLILDLYNLTINDKLIIHKIDNNILYFNTFTTLNLEEENILKLNGKTEFLNLTTYINDNTDSLDLFGARRIILKDININLFLSKNIFKIFKEKINIKYDLYFYAFDKNNNFKFLDLDVLEIEGSLYKYEINQFDNYSYQQIVMNMVPKKINIGKITNRRILKTDLIQKIKLHLLYYYTNEEIQIMMYKFFNSFNSSYVIQVINETNLINYIQKKYLDPENLDKIIFSYHGAQLNIYNVEDGGITLVYYKINNILSDNETTIGSTTITISDILLDNPFIYHNLLELTSVGNVENTVFTDFLIYQPIIVKINDNISILYNACNLDLEGDILFGNKKVKFIENKIDKLLVNKSITYTDLNNTFKIKNVSIEINEKIINIFNELYNDPILEMINNIEEEVLENDKFILNKIINGDFSNYTKSILEEILLNNSNNNFFNSKSIIGKFSVFKPSSKEIEVITNIRPNNLLTNLISQYVNGEFFEQEKLEKNNFESLSKLPQFIKNKNTFIENNIPNLQELNSNKIINKISSNSNYKKIIKKNVSKKSIEVEYIKKNIIKNNYLLSTTNQDNLINNNIYNNLLEKQIKTSIDYKIIKITESNSIYSLASYEDNFIVNGIIESNNFEIKNGILLNPVERSIEDVTFTPINTHGFFYKIKIRTSVNFLGNIFKIYNGININYLFIINSDLANSHYKIYEVVSNNFIEFQQFIHLSYVQDLSADITNYFNTTETFMSNTKCFIEVIDIFTYKYYHYSTDGNSYKNTKQSGDYYFSNEIVWKKLGISINHDEILKISSDETVVNYKKISQKLDNDKIYKIKSSSNHLVTNTNIPHVTGKFLAKEIKYIKVNNLSLIKEDTINLTNKFFYFDPNTNLYKFIDSSILNTENRPKINLSYYKIIDIVKPYLIDNIEINDVSTYIKGCDYIDNDLLIPSSNNSFIKNNQNVVFYNGIVSRTIQIKDKYIYQLNQEISGANIVSTKLIFSPSITSYTLKIINSNIEEDLKSISIDSEILIITHKIGENFKKINVSLNPNLTFESNKEYLVKLYYKTEVIYLNVYFNSSSTINLNQDNKNTINENLGNSLSYQDILLISKNLMAISSSISIYNFPLIQSINLFNEVLLQSSTSQEILVKYHNINEGLVDNTIGYLNKLGNIKYIYSNRILNRNIKIKIDEYIIEILEVYGNVATFKIISNNSTIQFPYSFQNFIDLGTNHSLNYDYNFDEFNFTNLMLAKSFKNDLFLPEGSSIKDNVGSYVIPFNSSIQNNSIVNYEEVLLLDENKNPYELSRIIFDGIYKLLDTYNNPAYIVSNGNNIKFSDLYINNQLYDLKNNCLKYNTIESITWYKYDNVTSNYIINQIMVTEQNLTSFKSIDILKLLIDLTGNELTTYFLLNNKIKIVPSINSDSLVLHLKEFLTSKNLSNFNREVNLVKALLDDLKNKGITTGANNSDLINNISITNEHDKKILQEIIRDNFTYLDYNNIIGNVIINFSINTSLSKENHFILEFIENSVLIHFVKIVNYKIISNLILDSLKSELLLDGVFKIKIVDNNIKNLENEYNIIRKINNNKDCSLIYDIPIILKTQVYNETENVYEYLIAVSKDILVDDAYQDISNYPMFFDENCKIPVSNIYLQSESLNTEALEEGLTMYTIKIDKNKVFSNLYVKIPNQITFCKLENTNNFIENSFKLNTYYTSAIENIYKKDILNNQDQININSTFTLPISYLEYFTTNLLPSIFRLKNKINSYEIKTIDQENIVEIVTSNNFLELPSSNFNLYSKSTSDLNRIALHQNLKVNKQLSINSLEGIIEYELFLKFCKDKKSFYIENNNFISKHGKIVNYDNKIVVTEEQYYLLSNLNLINNGIINQEYITYREGFISIRDKLKYNFCSLIIKNIDNFIKNNLPIDFKYEDNRLLYKNIDYSDIILSLTSDSGTNKINGHNYNLYYSFTNFIETIKIYYNNIYQTKEVLKDELSYERIFDFKFNNIVRYLQYLKYGKNYNQEYLENLSNNIYLYTLKKDNLMIDDEIYVNNVKINYSNIDGKNITFSYNHPELVILDLEIIRKANILKVTDLGKIYQVSFSDNFILEDIMDITFSDGITYNSIDIYGSNLIYNIDDQFLENIKFINLTDTIYIYKIETHSLTEHKYYFNINNQYLKKKNWRIIINNKEYKLILQESLDKFFILNDSSELAKIINNHQLYKVFEIIEVNNFLYVNKHYVEIEIDRSYDTIYGNIKINEEEINEITQTSNTTFNLEISDINIGNISLFIQKIHENIIEDINVNNFSKTNNKIYLFNYQNYLITDNTNIFLVGDESNPLSFYKNNNKLFFVSNEDNIDYYLENYYTLEKFSNGLYKLPSNLDFIDNNNDYSLKYYINSDEVTIDDILINVLSYNSTEETIILTQKIFFDKLIQPFILNEYDIEYEFLINDEIIKKLNLQVNNYGNILENKIITNTFLINRVETGKIIVWVKHTINNLLSELRFIIGDYKNISFFNKTFEKKNLVFNYDDSTVLKTTKIVEIKPKKFDYFKKLELYIDNEVIEKLDTNIIKNIYNYHFSISKKKQFDKITQLIDKGDYYQLNFPALFYFYNKPHLYLPLVAITNNQVRLEGIINYECNLSLDYQTILLDTKERYIFGSYGHEYLIERYHDYGNYLIDNSEKVNRIYLSGIIKNIYLKTIDDQKNNVETIEKIDYGLVYNEFLKEKKNNTSLYIRIKDEVEINISSLSSVSEEPWLSVTHVINLFDKKESIQDIMSHEFVLYILYRFTSYLSNKKLNGDNDLEDYMKNIIIMINSFKKNIIITKKPYIKTFNLKAGGESIFNKQDEVYQRCVSAYNKLNSDLPDGHYFYTFAVEPEESNPTGHINFNLFEESVIITTHQDNISSRNVQLNVITKEYNILKIISGMGALMWKE